MKTGKYDLITMLEHEGLEQFVIPEIQRDYVWQKDDVEDFLQYIFQGFRGGDSDVPYLGFIYAYNDKDYPYKYILIDGQQRITTIFILLLAIHHKIGKGLPEYMFTRNQIKVEYKVRQATRDFMDSLIGFCEKNPAKNFKIREQIWYHSEYETDRTIQNIIRNFSFIRRWISIFEEELSEFLHYLEEKVSLSYFDIQEARQGEDLYIYMNSRGRQLEPNETLKAHYLATTSEKDKWGAEWENWQDFFWKHKANRPDADAGFNDFLKIVQVLSMSSKNQPSLAISNFIRGKIDSEPSFDLLPDSVDEMGQIFTAYKWFVDSTMIKEMYLSLGEDENYLTVLPDEDKRQIYLLRILPIIAFLYISQCRNELTVLRFARFFYNLARKSDSIGKDISNQLPIAIKLMLEYAATKENTFDVCDLAAYSNRRTTLINGEEIAKLTLIKTADNREVVEQLFWKIEDHYIFDGEISLLLHDCINSDNILDLESLSLAWGIFQKLFNNRDRSKIAIALLYYGSTWMQATPHYYKNYDCMSWKQLVQHKKGQHLVALIKDLATYTNDIDALIKDKMHQYFDVNNFNTIDTLKAEDRFFHQIAILAAIDYHSEKAFFLNNQKHVSKDSRFTYKSDIPFFNNKAVLYNVVRYVGEGYEGRLINTMKKTLHDEDSLKSIIKKILNPLATISS